MMRTNVCIASNLSMPASYSSMEWILFKFPLPCDAFLPGMDRIPRKPGITGQDERSIIHPELPEITHVQIERQSSTRHGRLALHRRRDREAPRCGWSERSHHLREGCHRGFCRGEGD